METVEENPCTKWHVLEPDPCEMFSDLRGLAIMKIKLHNSACALVDQSVDGTELARGADSHTFVQRKYLGVVSSACTRLRSAWDREPHG